MLDKWLKVCYNIIVPRGNKKLNCRKTERGNLMEKKMTKAQVLEMAKKNVLTMFDSLLEESGAEEVKAFTYAIPTDVNGAEKWVEITFVAKDMMTDENGDKIPYDPFIVQANYQVEKEIKAEAKAERERKHAEKVAKAEQKRKEAKAKAQAKAQAQARAKAEIEKADTESAD